MSRLPPLNALRAFEASARNRSLTKAANELHVTPGAVSKQFRQLEEHFGFALATKSRDSFVLTPQGQELFAKLTQSFETLNDAVLGLQRNPIAGRLAVRCMPAFATRWLVPRLGRFYERYERVELQVLSMPEWGEPFPDSQADLAIMFGDPAAAKGDATPLKQMEFFPVCSPILVNRDGDIKRTRDLTRHVLLDGVGSTHWNDWFRHHGQEIPATVRRLSFEDFNQNLAAARCGIGIAMGDNITAGEELAQGALVRPLKGAIKSETKGYYVITQRHRERSPLAKVFIDWVVNEAKATVEFV